MQRSTARTIKSKTVRLSSGKGKQVTLARHLKLGINQGARRAIAVMDSTTRKTKILLQLFVLRNTGESRRLGGALACIEAQFT